MSVREISYIASNSPSAAKPSESAEMNVSLQVNISIFFIFLKKVTFVTSSHSKIIFQKAIKSIVYMYMPGFILSSLRHFNHEKSI